MITIIITVITLLTNNANSKITVELQTCMIYITEKLEPL